jgi:hypothetical protein
MEERPDLHALLYRGHRRVRVAGAALHFGGPDAGVATSILTASIAVRAIAETGEPELARPLHASLFDWAMGPDAPASYEASTELRPLVVMRRLLDREHRTGLSEAQKGAGVATDDLLASCDGARTVASIASERAGGDAASREAVARQLFARMRDGSLTWLPRP